MLRDKALITDLVLVAGTLALNVLLATQVMVATEVKYVSAAFSALILAYGLFQRRQLSNALRDAVEIYEIQDRIADEEFQAEGRQLIADCKNRLNDLAHGVLQGDRHVLFPKTIRSAKRARHSIRATDLATQSHVLHSWRVSPPAKNYYRANLDALKRGVAVQRVFIVAPELLYDPDTREVRDAFGIDIINQNIKDNIDVTIVSTGTLPSALIEDFIIFDNYCVHVQVWNKDPADPNPQIRRIKDGSTVKEYQNKLEQIINYGTRLDSPLTPDVLFGSSPSVTLSGPDGRKDGSSVSSNAKSLTS